jgi:hypothetical protein
MLIKRADLSRLLELSGCFLSMAMIVSILIKGSLPPF